MKANNFPDIDSLVKTLLYWGIFQTTIWSCLISYKTSERNILYLNHLFSPSNLFCDKNTEKKHNLFWKHRAANSKTVETITELMAEQNKRRNLTLNFRELAKLGKVTDKDQTCSEWLFWYDLFKNWIAGFVRDKVNDFTVRLNKILLRHKLLRSGLR